MPAVASVAAASSGHKLGQALQDYLPASLLGVTRLPQISGAASSREPSRDVELGRMPSAGAAGVPMLRLVSHCIDRIEDEDER